MELFKSRSNFRAKPPIFSESSSYRDCDIDLADARIVHLANQLRTGELLTLDDDFNIYRWGANKRFESLVPLRSGKP